MSMLFTGAFWGVFLILIGVSVLLKVFFHVEFPVFRIFFGLFFIGLGINIIFGRHYGLADSRNVVFGEATINVSEARGKYNVVFSKGVTDLTGLPPKENASIEVNTVFGDNTIYVKKNMPVRIRGNSAFGQIELPDGNNITFGTNTYTSDKLDKNKPYMELDINTVFGASRIQLKD